MIVEALVPDPRRAGSVRILVDGRLAWTVTSDVVASLALVVGQPVSGDAVVVLERAADEEGAYRAALRALERRAHAERELALKLERRGHRADAIAGAVERLRNLGLLDDLAFARTFVAVRGDRGRGPVRLRYDLRRLGVDEETIERALAERSAAEPDPLLRARDLILRRARGLSGLPLDARRRRLTAYLGRRGYRGLEARQLVEEALRR